MSIIEIPAFGPCERPNCAGDIILEFINYPASIDTSEESLVSWRIIRTDKVPEVTEIRYSVNNELMINEVDSTTEDSEEYSAGDILYSTVPAPLESGILYIQSKATIDGIIHFGDISSIIIKIKDS